MIGDLSGPKIRVGKLQGGAVLLEPGARGPTGPRRDAAATPSVIPHTYAPLARDVRPGEPILLDDGLLELAVERVEGETVRCRVKVGGMLKDKKGMNLPGTRALDRRR